MTDEKRPNETHREKRDRKRREADERAAARALRSDAEQVKVLADRGITSGREFDRLTKGQA